MTEDQIAGINRIRQEVKIKKPLIHCITSPIAINDCANVVLALGARPIMAEHPDEVAEITAISSGFSASLANITDARAQSIMIAGKIAFDKKIPSVFDAVGVTCSSMRRKIAAEFIREAKPSVIKGNVSEILALSGKKYNKTGIDASDEDKVVLNDKDGMIVLSEKIKKMAVEYGCTIMATGAVDIITDGISTAYVYNGSSRMSEITGTGCMLSCILATFLSCAKPFDAAVMSAVILGISGEKAAGELGESTENVGLGTFHIRLLDELSLLTDSDIVKYTSCSVN